MTDSSIRRTSILRVAVAAVVCALLGPATASAECTLWASSEASMLGDLASHRSGSAEAPIRVADFWSRAKPGDTLCLKNGIYSHPSGMIRPPKGLSGRPGAPITIRAEVDGGVLIDGGLKTGSKIKAPVRLRNNDYFVLEGFDVANSNSAVMAIGGEWDRSTGGGGIDADGWRPIRHVTVRRVVAWNANPRFVEYRACAADPACATEYSKGWNANYHVFDISATSDVLLEDVAAFGTGRKIFQVYLSKNTTIRRAWGRWEGNASSHTQTFSCAYRSYDSTCENVIATWSGEQQDPLIDPGKRRKTVLGMDWFKDSDRFQGPRDAYDSGLKVLGSLAYVLSDSLHPPNNVVVFGYAKNQLLRDVVAYSAKTTPGHHTLNLVGCIARVGCSWERGQPRTTAPLVVRSATAIGGDGRVIVPPDWARSAGSQPAAKFGAPEAGSPPLHSAAWNAICHRYRDGVRTEEPLWPWPMNDRIRAATYYAHGRATDVEADVEAILGPRPAACDGGVETPAGGNAAAPPAPPAQ